MSNTTKSQLSTLTFGMLVFIGGSLVLTLYEYTKELIFKGSESLWLSHALTIFMVSSIITAYTLILRTNTGRFISAIANSEDKYRQLFNNFAEGILLLDETRIIDCNSKSARMCGLSQSDMIGLSFVDICKKATLATMFPVDVAEKISATISGQQQQFEVQILHSDGTTRYVEVTLFPIEFRNKKCAQVVTRDITEGKLARIERARYKQELESERQLFKAILNNAPIGIWMLGVDGKIKFINRTFCGAVGISEQRFQDANHYSDLLPPSVTANCMSSDKACLAGEKANLSQEWLPFVDGNDHLLDITKVKLRDQGGVVIGLIGLALDITERKKSEELFRAAVEAAPNGMIMVDARGVVVMLNSQASLIFGYAEKDLIGQSINLLLPSHLKEAHAAHFNGFAHPPRRGMGEGRGLSGQHKDGRQIRVEIGLSPLKINGESFVLASVIDITERQQTLEQLRTTAADLEIANAQIEAERVGLAERVAERTAQLQYANKAKDSFLATMSHEIRTPLGGLMGMMELLNLSKLEDKQRELLNAARESSNSLLRIVNDILDWSKIEAGKLELAPRPSSITTLLKGVSKTYEHVASGQSVTLHWHCDDNLNEAHLFDRLRISQILNNLTSNAIKFTEQGNVDIRAERVAQQVGSETVCFSVKDSGIGISKEQQARLFQQYEQASNDTARMYGGTGLGLAICHRLAELMGGTLSVESTEGAGSTFSFTVNLPMATLDDRRELQQPINEQDRRKDKSETTPLLAHGRPTKILVVDDHPVNRMLLKQQLELLGVHWEAAESGSPALSLWKAGHFDMIITDCHMPEMDGYELTRRIREMEQQKGVKRTPIIAWTANVLAEEAERCRTAGMDDILTKPTELSELRVMLLKWLGKEEMNFSGVSSSDASRPVPALPTATEVAIDLSVLQNFVASRPGQLDMLQVFITQNRTDIVDLKTVLQGDDPKAVAQAAHRIKGASRMVGVKELEVISTNVEKAAKQGDMQGARVAADMLDHEIMRIEDAVARFIDGE